MYRIDNSFTGINFDSIINSDAILMPGVVKPSLPSEEINTHASDDLSFQQINVSGDDMSLCDGQFEIDPSLTELLSQYETEDSISGSHPSFDEINNFLMSDLSGVRPSTESNDIAEPIQNSHDELAIIKMKNNLTSVIRPSTGKSSYNGQLDNSISLSTSVNVTVPKPNQLQLLHSLEDTYRPRYKSDYFPQNGTVRRPRYVADKDGNHFVTLQMPSECNRDLRFEYVRVALITTSINARGHFYSPYKFQTNHNDAKVPDQNPIYVPVQAHHSSDYRMKLHLVLIKSKLDQLYDAQPLKPFSDTYGEVQNLISEEKLTSKDLINKYQLDKSHIAFTLCTKLPSGLYEVHPETTIVSSIITEASKLSTTASTTSEANVKTLVKTISCPNCQHCFDPMTTTVATEKGNKRKPNANAISDAKSQKPPPKRTYKKKKAD